MEMQPWIHILDCQLLTMAYGAQGWQTNKCKFIAITVLADRTAKTGPHFVPVLEVKATVTFTVLTALSWGFLFVSLSENHQLSPSALCCWKSKEEH